MGGWAICALGYRRAGKNNYLQLVRRRWDRVTRLREDIEMLSFIVHLIHKIGHSIALTNESFHEAYKLARQASKRYPYNDED